MSFLILFVPLSDEVFDLGWKLLTKYYRQAIEIAKVITGRKNETKAVSEFKRILNSMEIYLNKQQFPTNESNKEAYQNCRTMKSKQHFGLLSKTARKKGINAHT